MTSSRKNIRVVHLTTVHSPDDMRIYYKEVCALYAAGYDVHLLATNNGPAPKGPAPFHLIPVSGGRLQRLMVTQWAALRALLKLKPDVVHFHDAELIPLALVARALGKLVIYDVHENLSKDVLSKPYMSPALRPIVAFCVNLMEKIATRFFTHSVAATPGIAVNFPPNKVTVINNFPFLSGDQPITLSDYRARKVACVYAGALTRVRGLYEVLEALRDLPADLPGGLELAGGFAMQSFKAELEAHPSWPLVHFHGRLEPKSVGALYARVRVGLVTLYPEPNHIDSQPVKLFEYMAAGIPMIASNIPLWKNWVDEYSCGLCVDPRDPAQIRAALIYLLENPERAFEMGMNGWRAARENFSWKPEAARLVRLYDELTGVSKKPLSEPHP